MKKRFIGMIGAVLLLIGCVQEPSEEIVQTDDDVSEQEISIVTSNQLSKENYRMVLPFRPGKARGVIDRQIYNRVDIDEMEEGLRRHSVDVFDPKEYYFEDGQYLTKEMVETWIDELNPERPEMGSDPQQFRENPRYLSHILEQNYLKKRDDQTLILEGISLGIALKSVYRFQAEIGGPDYDEKIPFQEMVEKGEQIAQQVLERVRQIEGLQEVPIMIALYQEAEQSSLVAGRFIQKTVVPKHDMMIGEWEKIDEEHLLFPSQEARDKYFDDYDMMEKFGEEISKYFPNYVGYIGTGFYHQGSLQSLSIDLSVGFYGSGEMTGFTQYVYGIAQGFFQNRYDIEITIQSNQKIESVIFRKAGEEDFHVHIFH